MLIRIHWPFHNTPQNFVFSCSFGAFNIELICGHSVSEKCDEYTWQAKNVMYYMELWSTKHTRNSCTAPVAQWIRRVPTEHEILGSIPGGGTGRLAQMVERSLSMREARGSIPRLSTSLLVTWRTFKCRNACFSVMHICYVVLDSRRYASENYKSHLQNIVSFVMLFCKKDLLLQTSSVQATTQLICFVHCRTVGAILPAKNLRKTGFEPAPPKRSVP